MALSIIVILLFIAYSMVIIRYWQDWKQIPDYIPYGKIPVTTISVIVPARNEKENIGNLLQALQHQSYPKELFEIIVVDDNSTDETAEEVKLFPGVKLLQLNNDRINSYKKKAIEMGISSATGALIVTTDADCLPSTAWLQTIASFYEEKKGTFIAAPVVFENNSSLLQIFQALDFLSLQGITGACVYKKRLNLCNGANLAYERKAFYEVGGFSGIDHIASGDDMLLMNKIANLSRDKVHYLKSKDAIILTQPMESWKSFFNQRIRWSSKSTQYQDKRIFFVLLLVYLFNLSFLMLFIAGFWNYYYWLFLFGLCIAKTVIEFPFVNTIAVFFGKQRLMKYFLFFQPLHIAYTIMAGWLGQFGKYEWKGRKVK